MTDLILLRHGETEWNRERRIQGLSDIPLNETGRRQAREAAARLKTELADAAPVVVVSSDLSRAVETATIISDALGVDPPREYPGLRERGYGEAEGALVAEVPAIFGSADRDRIPGAESAADLRRRAVQVLDQIERDAAVHSPGAVIVAVAHGALIAEVVRLASGGTLPRPGERIPNAAATRLTLGPEGIALAPESAEPLEMLAPPSGIHSANRA